MIPASRALAEMTSAWNARPESGWVAGSPRQELLRLVGEEVAAALLAVEVVGGLPADHLSHQAGMKARALTPGASEPLGFVRRHGHFVRSWAR